MSSMTVTGTSPVQGVQKPQGGWSAQEQAAAQQAAISAQAGQGGLEQQGGQTLSLEDQAAQLQPVRQNDPIGLPQENTPTLMERMIEAQKKAKEQRDKFRIPRIPVTATVPSRPMPGSPGPGGKATSAPPPATPGGRSPS